MDHHYGQIVERAVRRNSRSITELAQLTNVNRRSIYNWFNQKQLNPMIIYRIGAALHHDFSGEMPELFSADDFSKNSSFSGNKQVNVTAKNTDSSVDWEHKYINLLEEYHDLLNIITNGKSM